MNNKVVNSVRIAFSIVQHFVPNLDIVCTKPGHCVYQTSFFYFPLNLGEELFWWERDPW